MESGMIFHVTLAGKKLYYSFHITNLIAYDNYNRSMEKMPLTLLPVTLLFSEKTHHIQRTEKVNKWIFSVEIWQTRSGFDATPKYQKIKQPDQHDGSIGKGVCYQVR